MTLSLSHPRVKQRWALLAAIVTVLSLIGLATTLAIHDHPDRLIQLDRDGHTATNTNLGAEDWQNVCPANQPPGAVSAPITGGAAGCTGDTTADSYSFTTELGNETIFTGGGSKDIYSVGRWRHKDGSVPPKDDMRHGFAAREGDLLYFGGDRFATQGTATFGVWFLQGGVAPIAGGTFSGEHVDGDLHIVADFQASGSNSAVIVREWVGDDATGSLQFLAGGEFSVDCVGPPAHPSTGANSEFCATANIVNTNSPWAFQSSSGAANVWLPGLFFEGGIDLAALDLDDKCFSDVILETRSSNQTTAVLKDLVHGELESCESGIVTTPSAGKQGSVSIGTGSATVSDTADITVSGVSDFGGTVDFSLCGPTPLSDADYTLCTSGGTLISTETVTGTGGTATVTSDDVTVTSAGRYCWRADYSGDEGTGGTGVPGSSDSSVDECFSVTPVDTTIDTVAGADVILGTPVTDTATLSGTASQPGDPIIGGPLGDPANGTLTFTLVLQSDCTTLATSDDPNEENPQTVDVSGDNDYVASFTPNAPGDYSWIVSYSGDDPNTNGSDANLVCDDTDEDVTVIGTSSLSTAQDWLPNDTATITGDTDLSGTVTFVLYTGSDCGAGDDDQIVYAPDPIAVSGPSPQMPSTSNTTLILEADSGPYSWLVTYDDDNLDDPDPSCETTTITIDDTP